MLAQARRAVFALAHLVGQVPMDFETEDRSPADAIRLFMELVGTASRSSQMALHGSQDGHFCAEDKRALEPLLLALIKCATELLQSFRGGA